MKVIIVEDEPRVRKGLSETVNWSSYGLELAGTASNGLEGLELFDVVRPKIVIADIRMPVMDGLAMSEAILEREPDTQIIIISGHDEFEYAQRCIALGVVHYLLKPIGKKQFQSVLEKLMKEWKQVEEKREQTRLYEKKLQQNLPLLRNAFLEEWLTGTQPKETDVLQESFSFLDIDLNVGNTAALAVFELDLDGQDSQYTHSDRRLLEYAMNNMVTELVQDMGLAFQRGNGQTAVIYQSVSADSSADLRIWSERAIRKIAAMLGVTVTVGMANRSVSITGLPAVFQEALHMVRLKLTLGTGMVLSEELLLPKQDQFPSIPDSDQVLLIHAVEIHDEAQIQRMMDELFARWSGEQTFPYPDEIFYLLMGIYTSLCHRLGKSVRQVLCFEDWKLWKHPEEFRSLDQMKTWWNKRLVDLSMNYEGFRKNRKSKMIDQVLDYVDEHIYDNITREDAAEHVHLNSSYLSRMFREVTGKAFSDYVMDKKMEKAIHMLQAERMMVYEVADRLGYKDPSYFARVFKKFTGKSPSEFQ